MLGSGRPNTFLAQVYDIGDPVRSPEALSHCQADPCDHAQWASGGRNTNCSSPNPATGKVDPDCVPLQPDAWNSALRPLIPRLENSSATPFFSASPHLRLCRCL